MQVLMRNGMVLLSTFLLLARSCAAGDCDGELSENILWPNTTAGDIAAASCPVGIGEAYRMCSVENSWQTIDYTHCSLKKLHTLQQQMPNASIDELLSISATLVLVTSHNVTLSGHVSTSANLLLDLMKESLTETKAEFRQIQDLVQNIIHSSGNLLDFKHDALWRNIFQFQNQNRCRLFVDSIESYGQEVTSYLSKAGEDAISCESSDNLRAIYNVTSGQNDLQFEFFFQEWAAEVTIPKIVFHNKDEQEKFSVAIFVVVNTVTNWVATNAATPRTMHPANVNSHLVSCSFFPAQPEPFNEPLSIKFAVTNSINNNTCSNTNINKSSDVWRQDGITTANINTTYANCLSSKLSGTFFAVVEVGSYRTQLPTVVTTALAFALILFFATFIMLLYSNRRFESDRATLLLFFLLTLMTGHITMVSGLYATDNLAACKVVALVLHFSQLSYSFWMLGQVVQLMLKVTYKTVETGSVAQYVALGWITPSFVVASSAGLQWELYGQETYCIVPLNNEVSVAFIIPICLIAVTNFVCLLCAIRGYYKIKRKERKLMHRMQRIFPNIRACIVVLPVLLVTWSTGAAAIHLEITALDFIWALMIVIFSVCVFLFYGVFSSEVQSEFELRYGPCCGRVKESPRPGWRDEVSQLSQMREASSICRDAESSTTNGGLPGISGLQVPVDNDDLNPWPREPANDSSVSLASSVASSLALKTKLKVFPLRKIQDQSPRRTIHETLT